MRQLFILGLALVQKWKAEAQTLGPNSVEITFPDGAGFLLQPEPGVLQTLPLNSPFYLEFNEGQDPLNVARQLCSSGLLQFQDLQFKCHDEVMKAYCGVRPCTKDQKSWECCHHSNDRNASTGDQCVQCSLKAAVLNVHGDLTSRLCGVVQHTASEKACTLICPGCWEGNTASLPLSIHTLTAIAALPKVNDGVVCEVGFNAGHSAAAYLTVNPRAHIVAFDLGHHYYTAYAFLELQNMFPDATLELVLGDSGRSIKDYAILHPEFKCSMIFVDGDHTYEGAVSDLRYMAALADPSFHMLVVDDAIMSEVSRAWTRGLEGGWVVYADAESLPPGVSHMPQEGAQMYGSRVYVDELGVKVMHIVFDDSSDNMFVGRFTQGAIDAARADIEFYVEERKARYETQIA